MSLEEQYDALWQDALEHFRTGAFEVDPQIESPLDTRRGLTLLFRPTDAIKTEILTALKDLQPYLRDQYVYPASDIHLTVLSVISCRPDFLPDHVPLDAYNRLISEALNDLSPFTITFRGLTASPSSVMIKGYPEGNHLEQLRSNLRQAFQLTSLEQTIDSRYRISTAHLTAIRYKRELTDPEGFLDQLAHIADKDFGSCKVRELEFVSNDWYQREANTRLISRFSLG